MRSEQEMLDLILNTARQDECIRAVHLNGWRANPGARRNFFQDMETDFSVNPGKPGKYFQKYLAPELWERLLQTYSDADDDRTWQALFTMTALFRQAALAVAERFGFEYPHEDDRRVSAHLEHVRHLPRDARTMY